VEKQSFKDFEWIIIDDCSVDNTPELIDSFIKAHPEIAITFIRHPVNKGIVATKKEALWMARGKYFTAWDHDDEQLPGQLQLFVGLWEKFGAEDIACINAKITDQRGNVLGKLFPENVYVSDYISMHNHYLVGNVDKGGAVEHHVCVKTQAFKDVLQYFDDHPELIDGRLPIGSDMWGMMAYRGNRTIYSNEVVRRYYVAEQGRSSMSSINRKNKAMPVYYSKLMWVNYFNKRLPASEVSWKLRGLFATVLYGLLAGKVFREILAGIKPFSGKVLATFMYLPVLVWVNRYRKE